MGVAATVEAKKIAAKAVYDSPAALFSGKCESTWASGVPEGQHGIKVDSHYFVG